jgi:hypothetical protein
MPTLRTKFLLTVANICGVTILQDATISSRKCASF